MIVLFKYSIYKLDRRDYNMIKKIAGMALALALMTSTPVFAATNVSTAYKAAPAVAVEILSEHGVAPTGDILKAVALEMGPGSSFMGVEKDDPMYKHEIMHYLHCTLKVIEMDEHECMHMAQ